MSCGCGSKANSMNVETPDSSGFSSMFDEGNGAGESTEKTWCSRCFIFWGLIAVAIFLLGRYSRKGN